MALADAVAVGRVLDVGVASVVGSAAHALRAIATMASADDALTQSVSRDCPIGSDLRSHEKLIANEEAGVQTIGIVLNVDIGQAEEFERGFRAEEAPIWADLHSRGLLVMATLTRLDISTKKTAGAVQFLVVAIFATDEGHHAHDQDPRFEAWNKRADTFQVAEPYVFGGDTIVNVGP